MRRLWKCSGGCHYKHNGINIVFIFEGVISCQRCVLRSSLVVYLQHGAKGETSSAYHLMLASHLSWHLPGWLALVSLLRVTLDNIPNGTVKASLSPRYWPCQQILDLVPCQGYTIKSFYKVNLLHWWPLTRVRLLTL